jgi:hypothetical protein
VTSTKGLALRGNKIEHEDLKVKIFAPWAPPDAFGRREAPERQVYLENVEDVEK